MARAHTAWDRVAAAVSRAGLWRFAIAVSFSASIARSGTAGGLLPDLAWYALQFGPLTATVVHLLTLDRAPRRTAEWRTIACMGLFVVAALASAVTSPFASQALSQVGLLSLMFALLALTMSRRWTTSEAVRGDMVFVFGLMCAAQAVGLAGVATGQAWAIADYGRFQGVLTNANYVGLQCATGIMLGTYVMHNAERKKRILPALGIAVLAAALVMSGSRGGLLALGVGALSLFPFHESRKTAIALLAGVAVVVLYSVVPVTLPPIDTAPHTEVVTTAPTDSVPPTEVVATAPIDTAPPAEIVATPPTVAVPPTSSVAATTQELSDRPFMHTPASSDFSSGRLQIWRDVLARWAQTPWLGTGFRTTQTLKENGGQEAHNIYLSVLAETGILGAIVFAGLLLMIFRAAPRLGPQRLLLGPVAVVLAGELITSSLFGWGGPVALSAWLILMAWAASGRTRGDDRSSPGVESEKPDDPARTVTRMKGSQRP